MRQYLNQVVMCGIVLAMLEPDKGDGKGGAGNTQVNVTVDASEAIRKIEDAKKGGGDPDKIMKAERQRISDIRTIAKRFNKEDLAESYINEGKPVEDFRVAVMDSLPGVKPVQGNAELGMSRNEAKQYSFLRAISAAARQDWSGAEFERECSAEVAKRTGKSPQGFFVPVDVMMRDLAGQKRDLTVGTDANGGYLVSTDLLAASFIEMLRNKMVVKGLGAQVLDGLIGDIAIPRQTGGATAYWVAEGSAPSESQQTVDQVTLVPKTVGAFTDISRKLLKQASLSAEQFVRNDLSAILAIALDYAAIHGSGSSNQPTGIVATSGIGSVAGGSNGLAPAWSHIVQLESEVAVDNADIGKLAYLTNAKVRGKLKTVEKASSTGLFVWENSQTPGEGLLNGYRAAVSNQVSSTLTKGSSTSVCSAIIFGNWADLIIGMWGGLDILVDPYTGSTTGTVRVVAMQDADIAVRHAESFAAMLDALTA